MTTKKAFLAGDLRKNIFFYFNKTLTNTRKLLDSGLFLKIAIRIIEPNV